MSGAQRTAAGRAGAEAGRSAAGRSGVEAGRSAAGRGAEASPWRPARLRVAAMAVLTAALTAAAAAALGGTERHVLGAGVYLVFAVAALFAPGAIVAQVLGGQLLAASLLLAADGPPPLVLVPLVAAVVLTAELLALVARLDTPVERNVGHDLRRVGLAGVLGGGAFGAVAVAAGLPGPTGLAAVALSAGACVAIAVVLARIARG